MSFSPKQNFQQFHEKAAQELRPAVKQPWFLTGANFAMAELASRNVTSEQMNGAVLFLQTLCGLADDKQEIKKLPEKRLTVLDRREDEPKEEKK